MIQYMIVLLDDTSASFCHYDTPQRERRLIGLDDLRRALRLSMVENWTVQMVYPDYALPQEYLEVINTVDHTDIMPAATATPQADVVVLDGWQWRVADWSGRVVALRTPLAGLLAHREEVEGLLVAVARLNVVVTDVATLTDADREAYAAWLAAVGQAVERLYVEGYTPQLNLLTDRMMLTAMNNCGAGERCITLAPNGRFYVCPAFYYDDQDDSVGDLAGGPAVANGQLYRLDHAPLCRRCDAWHCRRCVWLNRRTTLEVNTPGHEQCVAAHLERNAARDLMLRLRGRGTFLPDKPEIPVLEYLDPFDVVGE